MANVSVNGLSIVNGDTATSVRAEAGPPEDMVTIYWANTNRELVTANGRLAGILEARDELVADYLAALDQLAAELIQQFNAVHNGGWTLHDSPEQKQNIDFFQGTGAADIELTDDILQDLR